MSDKNKSKKTPATKKAATKKASQPKQLAKAKSIKPLFATKLDFEIITKKNNISYRCNGNDVTGDVDLDTAQGTKEGEISFFSQLGPIAIALYKIKVNGNPSKFSFGSNINNRKEPVTFTIPIGGKKGDEYKYSVVLFGKKAVLLNDPKVVIAN